MIAYSRRQVVAGITAGTAAAAWSGPALARTRRTNWSAAGLDAFGGQARALGVRALVVKSGGETILSDGDVAIPMRTASIRKSFLSALYGMAEQAKPLDLDVTVGQLGIDDYQPLNEIERRATIRQLLQARSGVYLPTAAETPAMRAARPQRGAHAPGAFWYYNNWDFNVLGEAYQRLTGEGLFTALEHRLLRPLGFEDFDPLVHAELRYDPASPRFPAYNLQMSARDLARFGQLFLDGGRHRGRQLVPAAWVTESTRAYSATNRPADLLSGYGYMWWVTRTPGAAPGAGRHIHRCRQWRPLYRRHARARHGGRGPARREAGPARGAALRRSRRARHVDRNARRGRIP